MIHRPVKNIVGAHPMHQDREPPLQIKASSREQQDCRRRDVVEVEKGSRDLQRFHHQRRTAAQRTASAAAGQQQSSQDMPANK